ncbi:MAG: gamma-glutamyltransferase, partial [Candidatus Odinarchaeota archaeon]
SSELGFIFNNEMGDFNPQPGYTSSGGLIGTKPNLIEPEKRMLSSMTPTIVSKDGKPYLIIGSPGGRTIINTVFQTVLNVLEYNMRIDLAIEAMRIVTDNIKAKTISHICYGDFSIMYPKILDLAVDQLDLEFANADFAHLDLFREPKFTKEIAVGVVDVHTHVIETKEKVKQNIRKALEVFPNDFDALYRLTLTYTTSCQYDQLNCDMAIDLINKLLKAEPNNKDLQQLKKTIMLLLMILFI